MSLKIIYAGTPEFAVPPLARLIEQGHTVCAVYSQPDRPAGRGRKPLASPVKQYALSQAIPVFQPVTLKQQTELAQLRELDADLMLVVAYGLLLPQSVIDIPRLGCINIHASLLPRWRGAAPIQRAIEAGDAMTGVSLMHIVEALDAGPVLHTVETPLGHNETAGELHDRLSLLGAQALIDLLPKLENKAITAQIQATEGVTYAAKISKAEARIDWSNSAEQIHRKICAFNPWPVAYAEFQGKTLRVWRSQRLQQTANAETGCVEIAAGHLDVACAEGVLRLLEIQLPGAKRISGRDFINAHRNQLLVFN